MAVDENVRRLGEAAERLIENPDLKLLVEDKQKDLFDEWLSETAQERRDELWQRANALRELEEMLEAKMSALKAATRKAER
jgi:hypothetical protein